MNILPNGRTPLFKGSYREERDASVERRAEGRLDVAVRPDRGSPDQLPRTLGRDGAVLRDVEATCDRRLARFSPEVLGGRFGVQGWAKRWSLGCVNPAFWG